MIQFRAKYPLVFPAIRLEEKLTIPSVRQVPLGHEHGELRSDDGRGGHDTAAQRALEEEQQMLAKYSRDGSVAGGRAGVERRHKHVRARLRAN